MSDFIYLTIVCLMAWWAYRLAHKDRYLASLLCLIVAALAGLGTFIN